MSPSQRLYTWTQTVAGKWPGQEAGEPSSVWEDTPPCSADSGLCGESDVEPSTSLSEPLTPDTWTPDKWTPACLAELEPEDGLGSLAVSEVPLQLGAPADAVWEHEQWLETCIRALEREVTEEELAQVDRAVDALARWEMFTGRLPAPRQDLGCGSEASGLRKVLGDKLSSLRKRLSARRLSRASPSPCRGKAGDN